ncbi:ApeP family dehydratase [Hirschia baltica]|uniref:Beta-hydroxyacyl-(Acyl-carrier-protein) dehydratase FabA/FabZ n=1 Tax=Hirschia baltica (strain ATCC 49814 / DSM 5838 / IFAM 1418) TaxID=582402 RepID=C6XIP7_HIRBI|nr:beta-hydroxyacyl-ACP dehydratase [Hirschia baltica]ACT58992.1 beta-hydroxyacyl-(acyl-carrier-protein) dehydratase FabA/FabZ [Hirschia baltica ATCC 49814]
MNNSVIYPSPELLAPHDPPMLLVDEIVSWEEGEIVSKHVIDKNNLFYVAGHGVPAYVGFEIMAQSIAVQDGYSRHQNGDGPKIGFLLGCRKYTVERDWFLEGEELTVKAKALLSEGEMLSFDCLIQDIHGQKLAHGIINVFSPANPEAFIQQSGSE